MPKWWMLENWELFNKIMLELFYEITPAAYLYLNKNKNE